MTDGVPSAQEQLILELINRFRANPAGEAALLLGPDIDPAVSTAINYFGVSLSALQDALSSLSPAAPLAWNSSLAASALAHNQAMIAADTQSHDLPGEAALFQRAADAGYFGVSVGEDIYAYAADVTHAHAGFVVDWGYDAEDYNGTTLRGDFATIGDGMQDPAASRANLINPAFTDIGIAATAENDPSTGVGPLVITEDLGSRAGYAAQFVGVVTNDLDHDHFYDVGEGLGGVNVLLTSGSGTYSTTTWDSGGWQIAVPAGTYSITFSGGALRSPVTTSATLGVANAEVDLQLENGNLPHAASDFDGDNKSDIFWRNDNGDIVDWLATGGGGFAGGIDFGVLGNDWHLVGTGDFDGDGKADLLWRNDNGDLVDWLATGGGGFVGGIDFGVVGNDWHVAGTGDFNGDGKSDILWRNDNGDVVDWLATGGGDFAGNGASYTGLSTDWHIVGTGDFDGDGKSDVLWRNDDGTLVDWLSTGSGFVGGVNFGVVGNDWHVAGTGDFNGDGLSDVLWRNDNGTVLDWLATGGGGLAANSASIVGVSTDWHIAATGDYDGDGKSDVLWRNDDGTLVDWLSTGSGFVGGVNLGVVGNDWHVQSSGAAAI